MGQSRCGSEAGIGMRRTRVRSSEVLEFVRRAGRTVRQRELAEAGFSRQHLAGLVCRGLLVRVARGCYRLPDASTDGKWSLLAAAALRWPEAVVCGPSAAAFHGLLADGPATLWLAVRRGRARPKGNLGGRAVIVREWLPGRRAEGVTTALVDGAEIRVVTPPFAVAELAELSGRIGRAAHAEAAGAYLAAGGDPADIAAAMRGLPGPGAGTLPSAAARARRAPGAAIRDRGGR